MRIRYLALFLVATCLYVLMAFYVVVELPPAVVPDDAFPAVSSAESRTELILADRASVRSAAVALLTGSAIGIVGLIAFLTYVGTRSEHGHMVRKHQDELFARSLELSGSDSEETCLGALKVLANLASVRRDLQDTTLAVAFYLVRKSCTITTGTPRGGSEGGRSGLRDRFPTAATALEIIGSLPLHTKHVSESAILQRGLDACDLGESVIKGASFEIVNFSSSVFRDSRMVEVVFEKCVFVQTDWSNARLRRVAFRSCDLSGSNLSEADRVEVTFENCSGYEG